METQFDIANVTVLMPVGGKATRALEVTRDEIPKHLIRLGNDQTVLEMICVELQAVGFRKFVFCTGHHKDQIRATLSREGWIIAEGVSYQFSEETVPLGVDGAILNAIRSLGLQGQGMVIPGDVMLSWQGLVNLNEDHALREADVTFGLTSYVTPRTTDVGKIIVENGTNRLLWCYGRTEDNRNEFPNARALTSAAATAILMQRYAELCEAFRVNNPEHSTLSLRDNMALWAIKNDSGFKINGYDIQGEILDLGTPSNIYYGRDNWKDYI